MGEAHRAERSTLAAVLLANTASMLGYSGLTVAMVQVAGDLGAGQALTLVLPIAFLGAVAAAIPATPWLLGRLGARRLLAVAICGLTLGCCAAAASPGLRALIASVVVQGLCAAPIGPTTQALVTRNLPEARRGLGMAVWGVGAYAAFVAGPLIGGELVETLGWRASFLVGLPFGVAALAAVLCLPRDRGARMPADAASIALLPLAVLSLVGLTSLGPPLGWLASPWIVALLALAIAVVPAYVMAFRRAREPVLDLRLLRDRNVGVAVLFVGVLNLTSTALFETEYLGDVVRMSSVRLGERDTVGGAAMLVGLAIGGHLASGRRAKATLYAGLGLMVVGKLGFTLYGAHTSTLLADWTNALTAFAFGLITTALATVAYQSVPSTSAGGVASLFMLASYLGAALGAGLLDEVVVGIRQLLGSAGAPTATDRAFHVEFWLELALFLPLFLLPLRFAGPAAAKR